MSEERKNLGIDEWLELVKEDKNLKGAYICFGQYMYLLEQENQQLKEELVIKHNQLEEVRNNKTDYTKVNILEMQLDLYKKVIEEVRECLNTPWILADYETGEQIHKKKKELLQILDKVKGGD